MPTCPGCQSQCTYEELRDHLEHCDRLQEDAPDITGDEVSASARIVDLERRVRALEEGNESA